MRQSLNQTLSGRLPFLLFGIFILVFCGLRFYWTGNSTSIQSDARGYYAYLPALLTYNDPSFEASRTAEVKTFGHAHQEYLVTQKNGKRVNKYFPGAAVYQAPFYGLAALTAAISGQPVDGYSYFFQLFFRLGCLFYALLGLFLFYRFLCEMYPEQVTRLRWLLPLLVIATPIFHYGFNTLSYSHCYSFGLFSLFGILVLKTIKRQEKRLFFWIGLTLGMLCIVRPTDGTVVLVFPLLVGLKTDLRTYFRSLWQHRDPLALAFLGILIPLVLLSLLWYWETGSFWKSSYGGEGFLFLAPHFLDTLFSFRIGLFLHTPVAIILVLGALYFLVQRKWIWVWWMLYFLVNVWIISSWWCWDYESGFGHRPFTQHFVFLLLPLLPLVFRYFKTGFVVLGFFALIGFVRLYTYSTGFMSNQRFTVESYFESLLFWRDQNFQRWQFTRSSVPYGTNVASECIYAHSGKLSVSQQDSVLFSSSFTLPENRTNERYYYRVTLDKKVAAVPFDAAQLVFEVTDAQSGAVFPYRVKLFNDKFEGLNQWKSLVFEGLIVDNLHLYDTFNVRLERTPGHPFEVRNIRVEVRTYVTP